MPEIAKVAEQLKDESVGIIGVLGDYRTMGTAITLMADNKVEITNILMNAEIHESLKDVLYIPYVYFVDSQGKSLGVEFTTANAEQILEYVRLAQEAAGK